ncbi:DUF1194 domain-containing protein [soil metagenome]
MGRLTGIVSILACVGLTLAAAPVAAAEVDVDLELVLAVDVSRSMDYDEQKLQRDGYVSAFRHPEVIKAITSGAVGKIAVTYMEWSGPFYQQVLVPWTFISSKAEAENFASLMAAAPITRESGTSISGGILTAARQFATSNARGVRQTIDVSGDGPNNMGGPVVPARDQILEQGITINGLPIMLKQQGNLYDTFNIDDLDVYYEDCVIGGPGAFMISVDDMQRFELAVRRKLVLEIAGLPPRVMYAAVNNSRPAPRIDCMVGEKTRGRFMDPSIR